MKAGRKAKKERPTRWGEKARRAQEPRVQPGYFNDFFDWAHKQGAAKTSASASVSASASTSWNRELERFEAFARKAEGLSTISYKDIPWPSQASFKDLRWARGNRKQAFHKLAKMWHPDKFLQRYGERLKPEDRQDVEAALKATFQSGSEACQA